MSKVYLVLIVLILITANGCISLFGPRPAKPATKILTSLQNEVIQQDRLKQGGPLLIVPFYAGVNVAATDELNEMALRIVKGTVDTLQQAPSPFVILTAETAGQAELELTGKITQQNETGGLKKWIGKRKKILSAAGKIVDVRTGDVILKFSRSREGKAGQSFDDLGYQLGREIGQYILAQAQ